MPKNGQASSARSLVLEFSSIYSLVKLCLPLVVVAVIIFCAEPTANPSSMALSVWYGLTCWRVFIMFFLHLLLLPFLSLCLRGGFVSCLIMESCGCSSFSASKLRGGGKGNSLYSNPASVLCMPPVLGSQWSCFCPMWQLNFALMGLVCERVSSPSSSSRRPLMVWAQDSFFPFPKNIGRNCYFTLSSDSAGVRVPGSYMFSALCPLFHMGEESGRVLEFFPYQWFLPSPGLYYWERISLVSCPTHMLSLQCPGDVSGKR